MSRVYYVTARITTRAAAEEAYAHMQAQGLHMHVATLTAKDKICFKDENDCDAGACSLCEGYYDRINGAVSDILANETLMTRAVIERYARKHRVCPFEFSLDVAYASDGIISDYNYVFDPRMSLKRLLEEHKRKGVVLVDEAHNLVERGRDMFSADMSIKGYSSAIYFSATLTPLGYYRDMLGVKEEDYTLQVASPFHQEQWDVRLLPLSIRYRDRERSKGAIADMLVGLAEEHQGNILVFFPSYPYLREVYEEFVHRNVHADTLVQSPGMTEPERDHFLEAFQSGQERTLLGFAVLGGVFAEGVDLPGDRLNGVVIIGVGLPQIGAERDVLREYFSGQERNGFNYAYIYPGMNKVLQAGGRLIRTEQDEGLLVLVDDRFAKEPYASLLPDEWRSYRLVEQAGLGKEWTDYEF